MTCIVTEVEKLTQYMVFYYMIDFRVCVLYCLFDTETKGFLSFFANALSLTIHLSLFLQCHLTESAEANDESFFI